MAEADRVPRAPVVTRLDPEGIRALSSEYIDRGVKQDAWEIRRLTIDGRWLRARLAMTRHFVSPSDAGGFHLTIFATQEFLAQLANIYLHVAAGCRVKRYETWMRECAITSRRVIRDADQIEAELHFHGLRWVGNALVTAANARVSDPQGGLFTARMKGLLRKD